MMSVAGLDWNVDITVVIQVEGAEVTHTLKPGHVDEVTPLDNTVGDIHPRRAAKTELEKITSGFTSVKHEPERSLLEFLGKLIVVPESVKAGETDSVRRSV